MAVDWTRLTRHLHNSALDRVEMSLEHVGAVVGTDLPPSSRHPSYWANTTPRAQCWRCLGYRATRRGVQPGHVAFVRCEQPSPALSVIPQVGLTSDPQAHRLLREQPFALLLGLLFDHGIPSERAWRAPAELRRRLGHLDPQQMLDDPDAVQAAVAGPPALHRYRDTLAGWVVHAARRVVTEYGGDAAGIWSDGPGEAELRRRLVAFTGIGETKASRALDVFEHEVGVWRAPTLGGDVA